MTEIHGFCDDAFASVRATFEGNFAQGAELGASVCVTHHGQTVVDLWAGQADEAGTPWAEDTLVNVWSTTKTMGAISMLVLADRGEIDLDAPVATYWPEFAVNGKAGVLVRHVLGHTAGVPGWDPAITAETLYDREAACSILAAQAPWWEPGTASGYHLITQGHLEGAIVERVTGRSLGTYFRDEVAHPLGADFHIGLPESEEGRVGSMIPPELGSMFARSGLAGDLDGIAARATLSCMLDLSEQNTRAWRAAELPAVGGTGNARSVARIHAVLANGGELDGVRLLSPETIGRIFEVQADNVDLVLGMKMKMGIGFGLMNETIPLSRSERACFWGGLGGSIALIDLDNEMTVAYTMNKMSTGLAGDLRGALLVLAANADVAKAGVAHAKVPGAR